MNAKEFGEYLKTLRKEKKLTIRQLDLYSGVSNSYISQMERGARGIPSPDILEKLAKPLGVEYGELMKVAGYIDDDIRAVELVDKLIKNLLSETNYDFDVVNHLTLEEKLKILIVVTESVGSLSIKEKEGGKREIVLGNGKIELTDHNSIDKLNLSYDGMQLTREEKIEFLAIAQGIFSARKALKENN